MSDATPEVSDPPQPRWQPLASVDRRVVGVLVEKAKTTPEAYPLSVNALRSGCNQKSNRHPLLELEIEDVEESLERLRSLGAVVEVQGGGRVARFRHCLYEWLGVDKVELAVMAELLLRGSQTEGELRGRAARMEPIADLAALRPVLTSLKAKGLVVPLSAEGRGHVVTHALFEPHEREQDRAEYSATATQEHRAESTARPTTPSVELAVGGSDMQPLVDELRRDLDELRVELVKLRGDLESLRSGDL
jgi:hypothetical protein